jgi:hypothetical protein
MRSKLVKFRRTGMENELHAYGLKIPERQDIHTDMAVQHDYQIAYLVADKNHLTGEIKQRPNLCYNFLFSVLFKRIITSFSSEDIQIIGDNRTVAAGSKNSLPEYIRTEAYAKWGYTGELSPEFCDSTQAKGLQAADLIASAIYAKYNLNKSLLYNIQDSHCIEKIHFPYRTFGS